MKLSPVFDALQAYPFTRLTEAKRAWPRAASRCWTSGRASRARRRRPSSARRWRRRSSRVSGYPLGRGAAGAARGDRRVGVAALRRRAGPGHRGDPDAGLQGGDLPDRPGARRRPRRGAGRRATPCYGARGAVRRPRGARAAAAGRARLPARTSTPCRADDLGARRAAVAQLPEQPDGRRRAARALRARGGAGARARLRARLRRGLQRDLLRRRAAGVGARRSPTARTSLVLNTLSKRSAMPGLPVRLRGRRPRRSSPRSSASGPTRARRRRRSSSARRWPPGCDEAHVEAMRRSTAPSARCCCRRSRRRACAHVGGDATMFLWLATPRAVSSACSSSGVVLAPGDFFGAAGRGLRAARARPAAGGLRAGGGRDRRRRIDGVTMSDLPERIAAAFDGGDPTPPASRRPIGLLDRGEVRVAEPWRRRRLDRQRVGQEGDPPVLPRPPGWRRSRSARSSTTTRSRSSAATPRKACASCRPPSVRHGAFLSPRRRADALLREHRRLGRLRDDGRHVGDRRLLRADRRRRAPVRRRRHRRRARAAAGARR